jgi:hypothetical protein
MADPRKVVSFDGIFSEADTLSFVIDNSTITYGLLQANGSAQVGLAVTLSADRTFALADDARPEEPLGPGERGGDVFGGRAPQQREDPGLMLSELGAVGLREPALRSGHPQPVARDPNRHASAPEVGEQPRCIAHIISTSSGSSAWSPVSGAGSGRAKPGQRPQFLPEAKSIRKCPPVGQGKSSGISCQSAEGVKVAPLAAAGGGSGAFRGPSIA